MNSGPLPPAWVLAALREGLVIPAHPLALTAARRLDERSQRALTRYYHAAGAGGLAIGVHTTQFEIRDPNHGLYQPVLELAVETLAECERASGRPMVRIAGLSGPTPQALAEARFASMVGYQVGLLSLAALPTASEEELIAHCRAVAEIMPLFGFYLQPAVGGRRLPLSFWRRFAAIPNVVAIKIAPFNRYQTLEVLRAVAEVGRVNDIALYTGNDDHIILDLITEYTLPTAAGAIRVPVVGGLLGHWACWTHTAVAHLEQCKAARRAGTAPAELLTLAAQVTDSNAAFFDAANQFAGVISGIHAVLHRQGLLQNTACLDPAATLSPGQAEEIERVYQAYPHLNDDTFVRDHLEAWLR